MSDPGTITCPACGMSTMTAGEWCPVCGHWDDEDCECGYCVLDSEYDDDEETDDA